MGKYLVTGACGGMGTAVCRTLAGAGHEIWGIDRTVGEGGTARIIQADITKPQELVSACEIIRAEAGTLDGILHTAGVYDLASLAEMDEESFTRDFDVNLFGVFRVNRTFLPFVRKGGRIVIVTSELAPLYPLPFTGIYAVTKAALDKYACALRMELQLTERAVIVIRPGAVRTTMLPESVAKLDRFCKETQLYAPNAARFKRIVESVEAKSVSPEAVAKTILRSLTVRRPRTTYTLNRNPLLLMLNALPERTQLWIIKQILTQ